MALSKATGVVGMATSTGNQDIALGFSDGKAIWLWATLNDFDSADSFAADAMLAWGISDGTNHYCCASANQDNQATTVSNRYYSTGASLILLDNAGAVIGACTASFSTTNLRLNWSSVPGTNYAIHYLVLGGTDITGCKLQTFTAKTSSGTQARTGFGFQPDFLFFLTNQDETASPAADNGWRVTWGCAADKASRKNMTGTTTSEDTAAADSSSTIFYAGDVGAGYRPALWADYEKSGVPLLNGNFEIASWDSDGYTEDWDAAAGAAWRFGCLALKGLRYDIGAAATPTSAGAAAQTGLGFSPEAVLMFAHWANDAADPLNSSRTVVDISLGLGAATSTSNEHAALVVSNDAADPSEVDQRYSATSVLLSGLAGTPSVFYEATLSSLDSDGFTLNFTTITPAGDEAQFYWIAFGPAAVTGNRSPAFAQII